MLTRSTSQPTMRKSPLEQDLLQSLQDIENGEIEIIDQTYFAKMLKQPVAKMDKK